MLEVEPARQERNDERRKVRTCRGESSEAKTSGRREQWLCERWLDDHREGCVLEVTSI